MIRIAQPFMGAEEEEAARQVLASGQLAQGPQVATFERRFAELCQMRDAVAVSSGTAALYLALQAHGIGLGDEVITSAFSFAATANAILAVGAMPVFVDIEADTYTLDPAQVEAAITSRTRAIMPVHLYGHPCSMAQLTAIAEAHALVIIEDACQAHAAMVDGRPVGSYGTGCFSFYATKNMTTGEGGMVTTNDPVIANRVRLLRNHGQAERYRHVAQGYNFRMTEMQAALGLAQLEKLEQFTERRIANAMFLTECLSKFVQVPVVYPEYRHVFHQYTIRVPEGQDRDEWARRLQARGVGTGIHYPCPIHKQPFYASSPGLFRVWSPLKSVSGVQLPVAEVAAQQVLSLPVHPALKMEELKKIATEVLALCD